MFKNTAAFKRLEAQKPVDLTVHLTPERIQQMVLKGVGFDFFYATERVSAEILDDLYALADEAHALEKMRRMQAGEILNEIEGVESEKRAVLHTAMRDQFSDRQTAGAAARASELAAAELKKLEHFL